jgi:drug/metabolite transporter (DMT)-like permease
VLSIAPLTGPKTGSAAMELHVFAAVLLAAAMHAGWNSFLKIRLEPFLAMTLMTGGAGIAALPFLLVFGWPIAAAWPWLIGSIVLHLGYYVALTEAYRRADMSQIYPIARGGAPLLTTLVSTLTIADPISALAMGGITILGCGIGLMAVFGRRRGTSFDPTAVGLAMLTALIICGYTLLDGIGARVAGDPHAYAAGLFVIDGIPLPLVALWWRGRAGLAPVTKFIGPGLLGGAMSLGSYWIAIWAMTVAPIALVAALRESSVLFATVIAIVFLKEKISPLRGVAAVFVLGGLVLIRAG